MRFDSPAFNEAITRQWSSPASLHQHRVKSILRSTEYLRSWSYLNFALIGASSTVMLLGILGLAAGGAGGGLILLGTLGFSIALTVRLIQECDRPGKSRHEPLALLPNPLARNGLSFSNLRPAKKNHEYYYYHDAETVKREVINKLNNSDSVSFREIAKDIIKHYKARKGIHHSWYQSYSSEVILNDLERCLRDPDHLFGTALYRIEETKKLLRTLILTPEKEGNALFAATIEACSDTVKTKAPGQHIAEYLEGLSEAQKESSNFTDKIRATYQNEKGCIKSSLSFFTQSQSSRALLATLSNYGIRESEKVTHIIAYLKEHNAHQHTLFRVICDTIQEDTLYKDYKTAMNNSLPSNQGNGAHPSVETHAFNGEPVRMRPGRGPQVSQ